MIVEGSFAWAALRLTAFLLYGRWTPSLPLRFAPNRRKIDRGWAARNGRAQGAIISLAKNEHGAEVGVVLQRSPGGVEEHEIARRHDLSIGSVRGRTS